MVSTFKSISFTHIFREHNEVANALSEDDQQAIGGLDTLEENRWSYLSLKIKSKGHFMGVSIFNQVCREVSLLTF